METSTNESMDVDDIVEKPTKVGDFELNTTQISANEPGAIAAVENVDNSNLTQDNPKIIDVNLDKDDQGHKGIEEMQTDVVEINTNGEINELPTENCVNVPEVDNTRPGSPKIDENQTEKHSKLETSEKSVSKLSSPKTVDVSPQEKGDKSAQTPMETEEISQEQENNDKVSLENDETSNSSSKNLEGTDKTIETQVDDVMESEQSELGTLEEIYLEICNNLEKQKCYVCKERRNAKYCFKKSTGIEDNLMEYICTDKCFNLMEKHCGNVQSAEYFTKKLPIEEESVVKFKRKCKQCLREITSDKGVCSWESMDFCREFCLYRYQLKFTKKCSECEKKVEYHQLGKYSVRFGSIIRQFCSGACLDARKKKIRLCSFCQLAMSSMALPVIALNQKFFCTFLCRDKYLQLTAPTKPPYIADKENAACFTCAKKDNLTKEFDYKQKSYYFCDEACLTIFRQLHNLVSISGKCYNCWKYATLNQLESHGLFYDGTFNWFCSRTCQFIHIIAHRKIMPCVWCKVKKYNFDLIHRSGMLGEVVYGCSLNCLNHLQAALTKVAKKNMICENCGGDQVDCEITTLGGVLKTFCSMKCVSDFQTKCRKRETRNDCSDPLPQITNVCSLATQTNDKKVIFIQEEPLPDIANKMIQVRTMSSNIGTQVCQDKEDVTSQTDGDDELRIRAVPVPIYVPQPLHTWNVPLPRALPFPLPVPVPILMPLTRDFSTEYLKTMKKEPVQTPRDPFESELLMMAELVASEKPKEEIEEPPEETVEDFSPEQTEAFNDDVLQMALKMATDYQESAVDLEGALQANTITPGHHPMELTSSEEIIHTEPLTGVVRGSPRGRGRGRGSRGPRGGTSSRRGRGRPPAMPVAMPMSDPTPPPPPEPVEKPDAHMCLKYTFGVNAWKQWVTTKNSDLERSSRKLKLFKTDLLQMTADELNYSLCLFVNEVRKPNGTEYAPDTIYYLCLGIQQYLYECGRIDNIFCDSYYDKFTDCLDEVCGKFSSLYNDSHYIVTRVEEEHLWESKQLGAHSPFVLLTTLMFFNTKHFNLTSVEEHMQLSFSHIMKHWKRNPGQGSSRQMPVGGRNVLLRFYPPQSTHGNTRKKKVYEQQENEDNPLRCPVKLYEFYLSKCPESVKTRNDVFYLLPERSCVPESPVWYSTMALDVRALNKMLHRVKMVKEINVALLTH